MREQARMSLVRKLKVVLNKLRYRTGKEISRFIGKDIRRDILIVGNEEIEQGILSIKSRTYNVLYLSKGIIDAIPEYSGAQKVKLKELWQ